MHGHGRKRFGAAASLQAHPDRFGLVIPGMAEQEGCRLMLVGKAGKSSKAEIAGGGLQAGCGLFTLPADDDRRQAESRCAAGGKAGFVCAFCPYCVINDHRDQGDIVIARPACGDQ